jgi:uncharacterized cofD-like protein
VPSDASPTKASIVALGGGHGLAVTLRAAREYAETITAVVSVADDGGSSGRLRRDLGVPAPGDLRKSLIALADAESPWPAAFEYRFQTGELAGHALGNLMIVGLAETLGDLSRALDEAGRLLGAAGRVVPATTDAVTLKADIGGETVLGQVAVESAAGGAPVNRVSIVPADAPATPQALEAIAQANQIVLAPGSLYTSVLGVLCVPDIRVAIAGASGRVVHVANLRADEETAGLSGTDQLRVLLDHGVRVDVLLHDPQHGLAVSETEVRDLGVTPVSAAVAAENGQAHDPGRLAAALAALL